MDKELKWSSPKAVIIILLVLGMIAAIVLSILRDRIVNQQFRQVTVVGQGKVSYEPDLALINLGVQIDKATSSELALKQLSDKMNKVIAAVKAENIEDENISTLNYSLAPQYDYIENVSKVTGYNANQQLVIKIVNYNQDSDRLNRVISAASKAGINQVNKISFDSSKINDIKQEARLKAITDAKEKGVFMAQAAGVELKEISGWYENFIQTPAIYEQGGMGMGGGGSVGPQTPSGNKEVVVEMNLTYNLK